MEIAFTCDDKSLTAREYIALFNSLWQISLEITGVEDALRRTVNITARDSVRLVGCGRILTDGYLFSVLTEVIVHRDYKLAGIDRRILELAETASPSGIVFGAQAVKDKTMRELGWSMGPITYYKRKTLTGDRRSCPDD